MTWPRWAKCAQTPCNHSCNQTSPRASFLHADDGAFAIAAWVASFVHLLAPIARPQASQGTAVPFFKSRCGQKTKMESYFPNGPNSSKSDRMSPGDGQKR